MKKKVYKTIPDMQKEITELDRKIALQKIENKETGKRRWTFILVSFIIIFLTVVGFMIYTHISYEKELETYRMESEESVNTLKYLIEN